MVSDPNDVQARVERRMRRQKTTVRWTMTIVNVVLFNLFVIISWAAVLNDPTLAVRLQSDTDALGTALFLLSMGWFSGLFLQFVNTLSDSGVGDERLRRRILSEEITVQMYEQQLADARAADKRKNEDAAGAMTLSDDGELVPLADDDPAQRQNARR